MPWREQVGSAFHSSHVPHFLALLTKDEKSKALRNELACVFVHVHACYIEHKLYFLCIC